MVDRILLLLKQKNLTISQFADEVGIQKSGMSHLISGRNKPSLELILKILQRYPEVKPEWLLLGTGDQYSGISKKENTLQPVNDNTKPSSPNATLFDLPETETSEDDAHRISLEPEKKSVKPEERSTPAPAPLNIPETITENQESGIDRVVLFFKDRTFLEYKPR